MAQRTLRQLDGPWPPPPANATGLVRRCHALRDVPIDKLGASDLRVLIGQDIGTRHLLPLALAQLEDDPLLDATFYEGDLLVCLLRLPAAAWQPESRQRMARLLERALAAEHDPSVDEAAAAHGWR